MGKRTSSLALHSYIYTSIRSQLIQRRIALQQLLILSLHISHFQRKRRRRIIMSITSRFFANRLKREGNNYLKLFVIAKYMHNDSATVYVVFTFRTTHWCIQNPIRVLLRYVILVYSIEQG